MPHLAPSAGRTVREDPHPRRRHPSAGFVSFLMNCVPICLFVINVVWHGRVTACYGMRRRGRVQGTRSTLMLTNPASTVSGELDRALTEVVAVQALSALPAVLGARGRALVSHCPK